MEIHLGIEIVESAGLFQVVCLPREGGTAFGYLALKSLIIPPMKSRFPHRLKYSTAIKVLSSGSYWGPTMIKGNLRVSFT